MLYLLLLLCIIASVGLAIVLYRYLHLIEQYQRVKEDIQYKKGVSSLPEQILISKNQLETVFDAMSEAICIVDRNFNIVRVNRSYSTLIGQSIKDILGGRCCKKFWYNEEPCQECPAQLTFATGEPVIRRRFTRKSAEEMRYYDVSTFPVLSDDTSVIHVIEFIRDVTDEKRVVEQLIRSEKLASIGVMTAGIAHEMNNPLSGISGTAVNILQMPEKYGINEKGISRVTTILESAARATAIMKDLLHLSRKQDNTRIMVDINATIVKTVNAIHLRGASEIKRRFALDESLPPITCDPSKLEQVVLNVVTNAIQSIQEKQHRATTEGKQYSGLLLLSTLRQGDGVLVTITDNGVGIPEKNRSRIFDPFFSTRPPGQGTGLGLSICHRIVEEHGGRLFFDSIDDLTVFSIELPIERKLHIEMFDKETHV